MATSTRDTFGTVKTEGAILPADLLRRLADGDTDIGGLTGDAYHLAKTERLNEAATRGWNRLQGAWEAFKVAMEKLPESDVGTTLTRERWLLILFQELGYGRLTTRRAYEINGKTYPISHTWQNTPIHLVTFRQELDRRTPGARGAARISPHSLVQEFLNRSDDHLWGLISNGLTLRILRDNVSLTRAAYVEFDLAAMMDGEVYSDFFLLFLLCHQSRVEVPEGKTPQHCWLEKWYNTAAQEGVRALDQLRQGVQDAIKSLGGGFLAHPANGDLREKLCNGKEGDGLSTLDYYRQVLRQVYRLLFLFVAEDRGLLLSPDAPVQAGRIYSDHYSTRRLRTLAGKRRGTRHPDLFRTLRLVFEKIRTGCSELGLPALGSYLFSAEATADLNDPDIANSDLLAAIRHLAFTVDRNVLRPVNYRNLGSEELGSVYESLLEMHPEINLDAHTFALNVAAGSERKTTGSYYTPSSLVNCLLDSALNPVLDEAVGKEDPEKALLALKICDPACGSGHFLIAAAHRLAKRLAAVRAGEEEPAPESVNKALRDVIGHCIYGVDINPMAVELCKVNLWMEALEPGKPLSFLDHRIKCGNSLLGTTPALLENGIPDDAFKPIEGDDRTLCNAYKRQNRDERRGQQMLPFEEAFPWDRLGNLAANVLKLDQIDDDTIEGIHEKRRQYEELVRSSSYKFGHLLADMWCAAFVMKKTRDLSYPITEKVFRRIEKKPHDIDPWMQEEIQRLKRQYQFFHWHLEFPDVFRLPGRDETPDNEQTGWSGGFDVVLGNPPWERIKLQEKEWFASRRPDIATAPNAAARRRMIAALKDEDPPLYAAFLEDRREAEGESHLVRDADRYPLCGRGDVNTYTIFAELKRSLLSPIGRVGCIVPSGIATDDTTKFFFRDLTESQALVNLYDFENREGIFPGVHRSYKFCLLTLTGADRPCEQADFVFFAHDVAELAEDHRHFTLSAEDIALLNPNTRTCPIFRSKRDAELTKSIYRRVPVLIKEGPPEENPWGIKFTTMFHMTNDSHLFRTRDQLEAEGFTLDGNIFYNRDGRCFPMWEDWMMHHFEHRYQSDGGVDTSLQQHQDPYFVVQPRYWVRESEVESYAKECFRDGFLIGFRNRTRSTDMRTVFCTVIPLSAVGNTVPLFVTMLQKLRGLIHTNLSAFVFDYIACQKIGGLNLNFFIVKQLPVLPPSTYRESAPWCSAKSIKEWLTPCVLELTYTAWDLEPFAKDCGYDGPPFKWDEERRFLIRCELDAAYFHLYLGTEDEWKQNGAPELLEYFPTPRHAVDYIMETFPIVKRKDEQRHGEYRTKRVILKVYDAMAEAARTGEPYNTILDPPAADPSLAHPPRGGENISREDGASHE